MKEREISDEERLALLKKGFNLWEILAYEYGLTYVKKLADGETRV